jgi:hypothetical protein
MRAGMKQSLVVIAENACFDYLLQVRLLFHDLIWQKSADWVSQRPGLS